jgi:hypothetical protein
MMASYCAMLLVHLSGSKAKLKRVAYLYLTPVGEVMIVAAPAPRGTTRRHSEWSILSMGTLLVVMLVPSSQR